MGTTSARRRWSRWGGVDVNAGYGILNGATYGSFTTVNHLTIQNNVFQNFVYQGVYLQNPFGISSSGNGIVHNTFSNMKEGVQTYAVHADISYNVMTDVVRGVSIHGTSTAADVGFADQITHNLITLGDWTTTTSSDTSRGVGIWINYRRENASPLSVSDNSITMTAAAPAGHTWFGIYGLTIDGARAVDFARNTINGNGHAALGYYFSSVDTPNVTITGGIGERDDGSGGEGHQLGPGVEQRDRPEREGDGERSGDRSGGRGGRGSVLRSGACHDDGAGDADEHHHDNRRRDRVAYRRGEGVGDGAQ